MICHGYGEDYLVELEAGDPPFGQDEVHLLGDGLRRQRRQVRQRLVPPVGERVPGLASSPWRHPVCEFSVSYWKFLSRNPRRRWFKFSHHLHAVRSEAIGRSPRRGR